MKPHQVYFHRNRGQWDWNIQFMMTSWRGCWQAAIPFSSKLAVSALVTLQALLGPFRMWTNVDVEKGDDVILHSTRLIKWGITFYRSEKTFHLDADGVGLRLEGFECYWPISFIKKPFAPALGSVDPSTTRAAYKMPMGGFFCDCRVFMEQPLGHMETWTPWFESRIKLTEASNKVLASRFEEAV